MYLLILAGLSLHLAAIPQSNIPTSQLSTKPTSQPSTKPSKASFVIYKGKPRTKEWFEKEYIYFRNKLFFYKGEVYQAGNANPGSPHPAITSEIPCRGSEVRYLGPSAVVMQRLNISECLVRRTEIVRYIKKTISVPSSRNPGFFDPALRTKEFVLGSEPEAIVHIEDGFFPVRAGEDAINGYYIFIGLHKYQTLLGEERTVPSYIPVSPQGLARGISKEQFRKVIESGVELVHYNFLRLPKWDKKPAQSKIEEWDLKSVFRDDNGAVYCEAVNWYRVIRMPLK